MMNGLKPCPFCGNKNIEIGCEKTFEATRISFREKGFNCHNIMVCCYECLTDKFVDIGFDVEYEEAVEMAKEKWNTRKECF